MRRHLLLFLLSFISFVASATTFELDDESTRVVGHNLVVFSRAQDTLLDIAREFGLGYNEIVNANPDVDVWLPGDRRRVLVPNQFILPDADKKGIVINLAEMRLYFYPERASNEKQRVITHPIGIGREGWKTPLGKTQIIQKRKDPTWTPPASILAEYLEKGDPLPKVVPAGPDNPLGAYAMRLGMPGYLLHGTNKPYGVGLRVSHGCIRLFPEDIEQLFAQVPTNTPVTIVYQPYKAAMHHNQLYVEAHKTHDDMTNSSNNMTPMVEAILKVRNTLSDDDWLFAQSLIEHHHGVVKPIDKVETEVVEDVWFIHSGMSAPPSQEFHTALQQLGLEDKFWPIKSAVAETLIGPFESQKNAELFAQKIIAITGKPSWVALVASEAL